jgi:DNA/RNA endonuclease YhcR with UshA esterase domain
VDYRLKDNFTVTFTGEVAEQLKAQAKAKGFDSLEAYFENKIVRVTGTVTEFRNTPQIELDDASQIQVGSK